MNGSMWDRPLDRRALLRAGATAVSVGVLAGCGGSSGSGGSGGGKKLSLLLLGGSAALQSYVSDTLLPDFSATSGYEVQLQKSEWGSGFQKVVTAAASGTLADVMLVGGVWTAPLASKGALLPLDDLVADWPDAKNLDPTMVEDGKYQDKTYALPLYSDTRTAIYRIDLLKQAGVSVDPLPTTWDEFRAVAQAVQSAKISGLTSAVSWGQDASIGLQQAYAQLVLQAGGTYYGADGKAQFSSAPGVRALEYMTSFYRDGLADVNMVDQGTGPAALVAGRAAMTFGGLPLTLNARQNKPEVEAALVGGPPLTGPVGKPVTSAWINKLGISAKTKDRDGAWRLVQHFLAKPAAEKLGELFGGLPTRSDLVDADYVKGVIPGLVEAAKYIVPQPPHPNMLTIAPEINTHLQQAIRHPDDGERILRDLDAKINEINGV